MPFVHSADTPAPRPVCEHGLTQTTECSGAGGARAGQGVPGPHGRGGHYTQHVLLSHVSITPPLLIL